MVFAEDNEYAQKQPCISEKYAGLSTKFVGCPCGNWIRDTSSKPVDRIDESEPGSCRGFHIGLPLIESLETIHQRPVVSIGGCCSEVSDIPL